MIVFLDSTIATGLQKSHSNKEAILSALSICCQQVYEGTHVLCASREVFADILNCRSLFSGKSFAILKRSSDKLALRKPLMEYVSRSILLVADGYGPGVTRVVKGQHEQIVIPVEALDQCSSLITKPLLMVENITDGTFLLKLVKDLAADGALDSVRMLAEVTLRCEIAPGGGHTLGQLYELQKSSNARLGIAVTDSDRGYPNASVGDTAKALETAHSAPPRSPLLEYLVLPVRASENLIPRAMIVDLCAGMDKTLGYHAERLTHLFSSSGHWTFVNIKGGLRCFELGQSSAESTYWTAIVGGRRCMPNAACESKKKCSHFVLPPLSNGLLSAAAGRSAPLTPSPACYATVSATWGQLAKLLFSTFCGAEVSATF